MIDLRGDETTSLQAFDRGIPSGTTAQGCLVELHLKESSLIAVRLADDASVFVALGSDLENGAQYSSASRTAINELSFRCRDL
jgi:hypothetical protein